MIKFYSSFFLLIVFATTNAQTTTIVIADMDNTIYSQFPDNSNGMGENFFVGRNATGNQSSVQRALLHFDLSGVPSGAVITDATLRLFVNKSAPVATAIELRKLNAGWGEGESNGAGNEARGALAAAGDATWSTAIFPSFSWATAGGDFSATVSASASIGASIASATEITLTGPALVADVQNWFTTPSSNFGWLIKSDLESTEASVKRFISTNNSIAAQRPALSITYMTSLPITLKGFSAFLNQQNVTLKWNTATENDNEYFVVEHSSNGTDFTSVGRINGNGTSTTEHAYTFVHESVRPGRHFYRLVEVDKSGNKRYTQIVALSSGTLSPLQLYPNPAHSFISVIASSVLKDNEFTINSLAGQTMQKGIIRQQQIDVHTLSAGYYWLTIKTNTGELLKASFLKK